jgi:hypothetical protein
VIVAKLMNSSSSGAFCTAILIVSAVFSMTISLCAQGQIVYVGLVEDDRMKLFKADDSAPVSQRVIVPAFAKDSSGWKPIRELKKNVKWTVAFDGKNLGAVASEPRGAPEVTVQPNPVESSGYPHEVHKILTAANRVPSIGQPAGKFSGAFGGLVRRPLVVVSMPNFNDPDQWKRSTLPAELTQPVYEGFRQAYGHLRECDKDGEPLQHDWRVPNSELGIVGTYRSNKGSFLVQTHLKRHRCVFNVNDNVKDLSGTQWFFVGPDHVAQGIGDNWALVDAGDYDGDGKSEVIFFSGDSETGEEEYVLFYDDFRSKVTRTWTYR